MPSPNHFSIVIPAYNEESRLPTTLRRVADYLTGQPRLLPAEMIVIDDGSSDRTGAVAEVLSFPVGVTLRLIRLEHNSGKGAAVRAGLAECRGEWVLICDADLATPIEEVEKLLAAGASVAVGSRAVRRELIARRQPLPRDYLGRLYNLAVRALGLTRLKDTQCGFKLIEGDLARRLAGQLRLDGFAFDIELLSRAERAGATVVEVPVRWYHMEGSRVHPLRHGMRMVFDSLRVRVWLWREGARRHAASKVRQ